MANPSLVYVDDMTYAMSTIDYQQSFGHRGTAFVAQGVIPIVSNSGTASWAVITGPNMCPPHFDYDFNSGGEFGVRIFENAVLSNAGTPVKATNINRMSAYQPSMSIFLAPSVTSNGTMIAEHHAGGAAQGHTSVGGAAALGNMLMLTAPNGTYVLDFFNLSGGNSYCDFELFWYEGDNF